MSHSYTFQSVNVRSEKSGKCSVCGKRRKRTRTFSQTINPYNKNEDGQQKTRDDILLELAIDAKTWEAEPLICATCEDGASA